MNCKLVLIFTFVAFVAGVVCEKSYTSETEKELLIKIFGDKEKISPEECLKYLHEIEENYAKENIPDEQLNVEQKSVRLVVFTFASKGEITEANCTKEKLNEYDYLMERLGWQKSNARQFLEFYKKKLAELCHF